MRKVIAAVAAILLSIAGASQAGDIRTTVKKPVSIPAQDLATALQSFAQDRQLYFIYAFEDVSARRTNGASGELTQDEALLQLLSGTGLTFQYLDDHTVSILPIATEPAKSSSVESTDDVSKAAAHSAASSLRLAQAEQPRAAAEGTESNSGQTTDTANEGRSGALIEEIVVTATKRQTNLQDTAMSVSVLGNQEIEQRGLVGMGDYLSAVPGVSVLDQGAGYTSIVMRGLSANPQNEQSEGTLVGVYFGETPISGFGTRGHTADIKMVDFERVEVLKGPQGTLYGASSLGGTVRNIPAAPDLEKFVTNLRVSASETAGLGSGNSEIKGVVSFPLIRDTLAVRLVGYRYENSGYYKNVAANDPGTLAAVSSFGAAVENRDDIGSSEYTGGRMSLLWRPTDKLNLKLTYLKQKIEQQGWPQADLELGLHGFQQRRLQMVMPLDSGGFTEPRYGERLSDDIELANATVEYDLGWASVLSSSSWIDENSQFLREIASFFGFIPWSQPQFHGAQAFIQEVRLVSDLEGPFQFVAGAYYEDSKRTFENWGIWGGDPARNAFGTPDQLKFLHGFYNNEVEQKALFGEVSYDLTERLKLTAGARAFTFDRAVFDIQDAAAFHPGGTIVSASSQNDATYKAGIEFSPNQDTLIYATWSQGFRLGRPVSANTTPVCDQNGDGFFDGSGGVSTGAYEIESDFVDSYELGGKRSFFGNRLQLSASVYQWYWDGVPINVVFDFCNATLNAGKARSRGVEFDGSYYFNQKLSLDVSASYVDAELAQDAEFLGKAGDPLPGSPSFNLHAGLRYGFAIAGRESFLRGDYTYIGGFYNNLQETDQEIGDFGTLNLRLGTFFGQVGVEVFANNITNEKALTWIDSEGFVNQRGNLLRPRTVGVSLGYSF